MTNLRKKEILRWVRVVVLKTLKDKRLTHLDVDMLMSAGLLGYSQSLKRFDPMRGAKFKTFAEYRIKGAVLDEVRKMIGDERCKSKRPRPVGDFDFDLIEGYNQLLDIESKIDIENFLIRSELDHRDIEILKSRMSGMNLKEIGDEFGFSESRASQLLATIKVKIYPWVKIYVGTKTTLVSKICPECNYSSLQFDDIRFFQCESCGSDIDIGTKLERENIHEKS